MTTTSLHRRNVSCGLLLCILFPLSFGNSAQAEPVQLPEEATLQYLKNLSIEELLQTQITSVSKKSEHLFNVAAAITVITQEDIERSGALTIPEALRLVPGLQVAQLDGSRYAISSRGFNEYFANKLLVLIDGRSVYTPLFSGVYWNAQDTVMEDIERIEVIRGPGATVWGANAVNGVINIITKNSADTQGGRISTVVGNYIQPMISTRYGGHMDDDTTFRLYAKGFERENYDSTINDGDANDAWESLRAGFRADRIHTSKDTLSLQAEVYDNEADMGYELPDIRYPRRTVSEGTEDYAGGHILTTWEHRFNSQSSVDLHMYYDHTRRDQVVVEETRDTFDIELKHHWDPAGTHDIVWGGNFRNTEDSIDGTTHVSFNPDSSSDNLWSAFIQDDINLIPDTAWITLGSKFEHNDYSGFEIQPSVRFRYKPSQRQLIWAAVSRAVRTPSRIDQDFEATFDVVDLGSTLGFARLYGEDSFDSEKLIAYEFGYRWQASDDLSFDLATYYNVYDDIRLMKAGPPFLDTQTFPPVPVFPAYFNNGIEGNTYGFELQGTWQATKKLKIYGAYTWIDIDMHEKDPLLPDNHLNEEELTPQQQVQLRSYLDLSHNLSLNTELYLVDELKNRDIDAYIRVDMQLSWQANQQLKISVAAENLFNSSHQEFPQRDEIKPSEIPQQYWLKATYSF